MLGPQLAGYRITPCGKIWIVHISPRKASYFPRFSPHFWSILTLAPPQLWVASIKGPATRPPTLWPPHGRLSTKTLWCCQHLHFVLQIPLPPLPFKPFFIASEPPLARPTTQVASPCHGWLFKPRPASTVAARIFVGNSTYPDGVSTTFWLFFCQLAARLRWLAPPSHSSSLPLLNVTGGSLCHVAVGIFRRWALTAPVVLDCLRLLPPVCTRVRLINPAHHFRWPRPSWLGLTRSNLA